MKHLQAKLERSVGKSLFVELYNLTPDEQKEYLKNKTYIKNGEIFKYTKGAIIKRVCTISRLKNLGLMQDVLFDIYFRSKCVDVNIRKKARKYYNELRFKSKISMIKKLLKKLILIKNR